MSVNPLPRLMKGEDLSTTQAQDFADALFEGQVSEGLLGGVLVALARKGETARELLGFARSMRAHVADLGFTAPEALDTCGTGGSGKSVLNTGTLSALVVAAAGGKVAKHGNRAVSGVCGSADLLEALGVPLTQDAPTLKAQYDRTGFVFLFAPACHPAMKHAMPTRRALGVRTIFNFLGPLTNPLGARRHLLGVGEAARLPVMAEALRGLGVDKALVLHAQSGLDEVDLSGPTQGFLVEGDDMKPFPLTPADLGLPTHPLASFTVHDVAHGHDMAQAVLAGQPGAPLDFLLANAGVALWLAGLASAPRAGVALARETLASGKVDALLAQLKAGG